MGTEWWVQHHGASRESASAGSNKHGSRLLPFVHFKAPPLQQGFRPMDAKLNQLEVKVHLTVKHKHFTKLLAFTFYGSKEVEQMFQLKNT